MFKYLLKRNIIEILPIESSYYKNVDFTEKVALTPELLRLNYSRFSPYETSEIIYYSDNNALHLWFYERRSNAWIVIPEAYIFFKAVQAEYRDAVVLVREETIKGLVIKNGDLAAVFNMSAYDSAMLRLMMDTHGIDKLVELEAQTYKTLISKGIETLSPAEMIRWKRLDITPKSVAKQLYEKSAYALAAVIMVVILSDALHSYLLNSSIEELTETYSELKKKNDPLRQKQREEKRERDKWSKLVSEELVYPDTIAIIDNLYTVIEDKRFSLKEITIANGRLRLTVESEENPVSLLNQLIASSYFEDVRISGSHTPKRGKKWIKYEARIKPLGENSGL